MKKYRAIIYDEDGKRVISKIREFKTYERAERYAEKNATEKNGCGYNIQAFW